MATMTISLPDLMADWIEARVREGDRANASDYVRDLVRRDRARQSSPEYTMDDLRRKISEARASGLTESSALSIFAEVESEIEASRYRNG